MPPSCASCVHARAKKRDVQGLTRRVDPARIDGMRYVRKTLWVGQVWLTTVMTFVAGIPHVACLCPNGNFKPFCLASTCGGTGCCCGGRCCTAGSQDSLSTESTREVSCCCCQDAEPQRSETSDSSQHLGDAACTKMLAQSNVLAVRSEEVRGKEVPSAGPILLLETALAWEPQTMAPGRPSPLLHGPPLPTDLVILLQHFVI